MNSKKLWTGWAVTFIITLFIFVYEDRDFARTSGLISGLLGWMAWASEGNKRND